MPFGIGRVDTRLADAGLCTAALHEVAASAPTLAEDAAATLFLAGIAARFAGDGASALWAVTRFDLYAPGLEQAGLRPDRALFVEARDDKEVLAVMEDALRHGSLAAVIGEVRRADMTATRRLQLAASEGGTPAFLMRRWRKTGACPLGEPSAATTRWRIGCAPAAPLGIPGVGRQRWTVELVRQRNGAPFSLVLEGCDAQGRLALPTAASDRAAALGRATARAA
ncbi:MAG: protein ImuA [Sphingomonadales bacterium]|nr:MAG: protein ImuA [Sphingomonadales bacterium]